MANEDFMRRCVVTTYSCKLCGSSLLVGGKGPRAEFVNDGITGAAKVESVVYVHPCSKCMRPLEEARQAFKTLQALASNKGDEHG